MKKEKRRKNEMFRKAAEAGWFKPPAHTHLMRLMKAVEELMKDW